MRVLGGVFKNRELKTPKGEKTRPTCTKVRKSLFDILQHIVESASVLDLFAGSGSLGIEALSRGASQVYFVEKERMAVECIRKNLQELGEDLPATVLHMQASLAVGYFTRHGICFDLIYVDPPYTLELGALLEELSSILSTNGLIILEQSKKAEISTQKLIEVDKRLFGDTALFFFSHRPL